MNKKIAIQLSGQSRVFDGPGLVYSNLKEFYPEYDFYFFLAGWDYEVSKYDKFDFFTSKKFFKDDLPVHYVQPGNYEWKNHSNRLMYLLEESNNLREEYEKNNNFKFDLVVWTRVDVILFPGFFNAIFKRLNFKNNAKGRLSDHIVFNDIGLCSIDNAGNDELYTNDRVFYGNSTSMSKFSKMYSHFYIDHKADTGFDAHRSFASFGFEGKFAIVKDDLINYYKIIRPDNWPKPIPPAKVKESVLFDYFDSCNWKKDYKEFNLRIYI